MHTQRVHKEILKSAKKKRESREEEKFKPPLYVRPKKPFWLNLLESLSFFNFNWLLPPFS